MATVSLDPANRIEGHQSWEVDVDGSNYVTAGKVRGVMFRGFEKIMIGRDPRDAIVICGRI